MHQLINPRKLSNYSAWIFCEAPGPTWTSVTWRDVADTSWRSCWAKQ